MKNKQNMDFENRTVFRNNIVTIELIWKFSKFVRWNIQKLIAFLYISTSQFKYSMRTEFLFLQYKNSSPNFSEKKWFSFFKKAEPFKASRRNKLEKMIKHWFSWIRLDTWYQFTMGLELYHKRTSSIHLEI